LEVDTMAYFRPGKGETEEGETEEGETREGATRFRSGFCPELVSLVEALGGEGPGGRD
jgi:hypothetical protein